MKGNNLEIIIPKLNKESMKIIVYSDASMANMDNAASQLGYIIFLCDEENRCAPISWSSRKSRRVARSTLTAETLAAVDAVDTAFVVKKILEEILARELPAITLKVDNKSLYDAVKTTNTLAEKRLMIDMTALRQMVERREVEIEWIPTGQQLANVLTKEGADKRELRTVIAEGRLSGHQ